MGEKFLFLLCLVSNKLRCFIRDQAKKVVSLDVAYLGGRGLFSISTSRAVGRSLDGVEGMNTEHNMANYLLVVTTARYHIASVSTRYNKRSESVVQINNSFS